jgi:hypothetical protein
MRPLPKKEGGKIMSGAITKTDLNRMVGGINLRAGHPEGVASFTEYEEGVARSTLGYYYLQGEWGGWKLYHEIGWGSRCIRVRCGSETRHVLSVAIIRNRPR